MTAAPKPTVVLFVDDVPRLAAFYRALADMTVEHEDSSHAVLDIAGTQLVIHAMHPPSPASGAAVSPVTVREDSYWKLCLPVASIAVARDLAATLGGQIAPSATEWEARGFRACDGHDPEGNVLQVREAVP